MFVQDGAKTSERGYEALNAFRTELSVAAQLRDRIKFRLNADSPLALHYNAALEALGEVSGALGVAAMWPNDRHYDANLKELHDRMTSGEETFKSEREALLDAARREFSG